MVRGTTGSLAFPAGAAVSIPRTLDGSAIGSSTTARSPGNPRQQINTVNSFIDGWNVYGGTLSREEWLRDGPFAGDM